ncbi:heptaprenyl diphosphate synthase component II [Paenibacillus larvae]|uniref:Heptaprenyl diphosphate synthase component II n=1 Tax=Paenibacillus larvae TaxID=1464 RepID=A0AAP5JRF8_9BACL|nr:heptaprenyl diphosphate synthase component II [Paenibacillus larvae]AQR79438.1 heptaprenyl diphosphate synthase component II [Paenibacillus larvae subsp. larvae]AVF23381.1 heptaprenyl diphosphate synthase component 2 [Paenibacillus larvae subsp. larvae]MCY7476190.1 heptaprenyl diphosphate synthase component II [Paenibacillus larvae]MCY7489032.1 heptaprenyl diphosphate synthase component II [Paenibacillus larvae]MCY9561858.1 heptaprenyl diphosphate synthase component II [Paenibacillus larvae
MKLLDIYSRKKKDIAFIEKSLERSIDVDLPTLRDASLLYLKAGGKRIRPVFVLLAGEFGHYDLERMKHIAVPLELIHMASLVHDDVIDDAETRRGKATVRSKWDNRIAMYTGDYVYAKALTLVTELKNPAIHQIMSKAMIEMSIGEMEQIRLFFEHGQTLRDYLRRIKRKTALLIAVSCQLGAMTAEASENYAKRLFHFGYYVGMAFQIRDDILDLVGTEKQIGKPPGSDIKQGNITLPVLYALQEPKLRKPMLEELDRIRKADGQTDVSRFLNLVRESGGIEKADEIAETCIQKAIASIDPLPDIQAKKDLVNIAYFIAKRSY